MKDLQIILEQMENAPLILCKQFQNEGRMNCYRSINCA